MNYPGDSIAIRSVYLPATMGEDSLSRRCCTECKADCTDLHAAVFVGRWWFYCIGCALEFVRAYGEAA